MSIIESQWDDFRRLVIPNEASAVQVREMKRSFFAGAEAMMTVMRVCSVERVTEDEAEHILVEADTALREFAQAVEAGKA